MNNKAKHEKLLKAIFSNDVLDDACDMPEGWPDTNAEKTHYAQYAVIDAIKYVPPVLTGLKRLCDMHQVSDADSGGSLPDAITHHEIEEIQKNLLLLKDNIDDAFNRLMEVWEDTGREATDGRKTD